MRNTRTTRSFKLPSEIEDKMNKKLVADGYGLRGKSRWICDAIQHFLQSNDQEFCIDCILYADDLEKLDKSVSFRPSEKVDALLNDWVLISRKHMPTLEGVRSKIIRASIFQGLLLPSLQ